MCDCVSETQQRSTRAHESPPRSCEGSRSRSSGIHASLRVSHKLDTITNTGDHRNPERSHSGDVPGASRPAEARWIDRSGTREQEKGRWEAFGVSLKFPPKCAWSWEPYRPRHCGCGERALPGPSLADADRGRQGALTPLAHARGEHQPPRLTICSDFATGQRRHESKRPEQTERSE